MKQKTVCQILHARPLNLDTRFSTNSSIELISTTENSARNTLENSCENLGPEFRYSELLTSYNRNDGNNENSQIFELAKSFVKQNSSYIENNRLSIIRNSAKCTTRHKENWHRQTINDIQKNTFNSSKIVKPVKNPKELTKMPILLNSKLQPISENKEKPKTNSKLLDYSVNAILTGKIKFAIPKNGKENNDPKMTPNMKILEEFTC